jgi:hypothetical protein
MGFTDQMTIIKLLSLPAINLAMQQLTLAIGVSPVSNTLSRCTVMIPEIPSRCMEQAKA